MATAGIRVTACMRERWILKLRTLLCLRAASMSHSTHLERTKDIERQQDVTEAVIRSVINESPTVKKLTLCVKNSRFSFKAGQWVDFFIPGVNTIGGFSMCSAPKQLKENRELELAVKYSKHPPAFWVHTECKEGDKVMMRVGGNFFYDPPISINRKNLLLIAGGVGINPIFSILQHVQDLNKIEDVGKRNLQQSVLLFSAKSPEELLFKNQIDEIIKQDTTISCKYHITGQEAKSNDASNSFSVSRIDESTISSTLEVLGGTEHTICYICGPPPMIEEINGILKNIGLPKDSIHFEKWW